MTRTLKICDSPYVIGYWSRVHGLSFDEVSRNDDLADCVVNERDDFDDGFNCAGQELEEEPHRPRKMVAGQKKMRELIGSLREAFNPEKTL